MFEDVTANWWMWLIAGFALAMAEVFTPGGLFLLFFGVSAMTVGVLAAAGMARPLWLQVLLFSVLSVVAVGLFRRSLVARLNRGSRGEDVEDLVGETAHVLADLEVNATGRAELRGTSWDAQNVDERPLVQGEACRVKRVEGLTLLLKAK